MAPVTTRSLKAMRALLIGVLMAALILSGSTSVWAQQAQPDQSSTRQPELSARPMTKGGCRQRRPEGQPRGVPGGLPERDSRSGHQLQRLLAQVSRKFKTTWMCPHPA